MQSTILATAIAAAMAAAAGSACATEGVAATDRISAGAKLTKADAARSAQGEPRMPAGTIASSAQPGTPHATSPQGSPAGFDGESEDETAARGIEKKDIRRGMVIAKPGSITPHMKTRPGTSDAGAAGQTDQRSRHDPVKRSHETVPSVIRNIR